QSLFELTNECGFRFALIEKSQGPDAGGAAFLTDNWNIAGLAMAWHLISNDGLGGLIAALADELSQMTQLTIPRGDGKILALKFLTSFRQPVDVLKMARTRRQRIGNSQPAQAPAGGNKHLRTIEG